MRNEPISSGSIAATAIDDQNQPQGAADNSVVAREQAERTLAASGHSARGETATSASFANANYGHELQQAHSADLQDDHQDKPPTVSEASAAKLPSVTGELVGNRSARSLTTATAFAFTLRLVAVGVGVITTSVLARHLSPSGYGVLAFAMTLSAAAAQTADMGLSVTVASRVATAGRSAGSVLSAGLALRSTAAVAATVGLVAAGLAGAFGSQGAVIAVVALATPLSAGAVLTAGSTARFRPEISSLLAVAQALLWLTTVLLASHSGQSVLPFAWSFVLVALLQAGLGVALNRRIVPLDRPTMAHARQLLSASWPLAINALAVTAYYRLDSLILFVSTGSSEVGFYSAAYKFIDVAQIVPATIVPPLIALGAISTTRNAAYKATLLSLATRTGVLIGVVTAVGLIVLAEPVITWLYGPKFMPSTEPLRLLGVAFLGISVGYVGTTLCSAVGKVRSIATLTVLTAMFSLSAQAWAAPRWGAVGAAAVTASTELVIGSCTCFLAVKAIGARPPLSRLLGIVLAGAAAILATAAVHLPSLAEVGLAAAVLGLGLALTRAFTRSDLSRVFSRRAL